MFVKLWDTNVQNLWEQKSNKKSEIKSHKYLIFYSMAEKKLNWETRNCVKERNSVYNIS